MSRPLACVCHNGEQPMLIALPASQAGTLFSVKIHLGEVVASSCRNLANLEE